MSVLKVKYESADDIPDGYSDLFEEQDGTWILTGIDGMKTQGDIDRVNDALRKEKNDHKKARDRLRAFGDKTPEDIETLIEERDELLARVDAGGGDPKKVEEQTQQLIEARRENAKMKRDLEKLQATNQELTEAENAARGKLNDYTIDNAIAAAMREVNVLPVAQDDALLLARSIFQIEDDGKVVVKDQVGYTPGLEPKDWFGEIKDKRPHWWGENKGGGVNGGNRGGSEGANPFRKGSFSLGQIGNIYKSDPVRAKRLYEAARAANDLHDKAFLPEA